MSNITRLQLQLEYMNRGIVPLSGLGAAHSWNDINRILAELPPDEAHRMRRRFRKEWRKLVKRQLSHGGKKGRQSAREVGLGAPHPKKTQKNARKNIVRAAVGRKVLTRDSLSSLW